MFSKNVELLCKYSDNIRVQKVTDNYINRGLINIELKNDIVRLSFNCNIFKLKKLKHDLEVLYNIGIETEMKEA